MRKTFIKLVTIDGSEATTCEDEDDEDETVTIDGEDVAAAEKEASCTRRRRTPTETIEAAMLKCFLKTNRFIDRKVKSIYYELPELRHEVKP